MKIFAVLLLGSIPSWAVLGEYENSVASDQQHMHTQLHQVAGQGYSIKQLTSANGKTAREYVSPGDMVLGVAWQGPTRPDLQQLLGSSYYGQLQQAAQTRKRRGGPFSHKK